MTDINAESFSALNFWKSVEKKNISINFGKESRPAPKKINVFPLLAPPPPPPPPAEEDFKSNKSEWDEQNVTGAFGFWKQKAIQLQQETERYNARRNSRATVDLTNILRKSTSNSDLSSPDQPKTPTSPHSPLDIIATTTIVKTTTTTTTTSSTDNDHHHHHSHIDNNNNNRGNTTPTSSDEDEEYSQKTTTVETTNTLVANQLEIKVGGETIVVVDDLETKKSPRDYRRSRSISCEIIPLVPNATSTTVVTESITTTTIVEEDKQLSDVESDSSVEDSDETDSNADDTESEEYEESTKHQSSTGSANNSNNDLSNIVNHHHHHPIGGSSPSADEIHKPDQASLDSALGSNSSGTAPKAQQQQSIQQPESVTLVHYESQSQSQSVQPQPQIPVSSVEYKASSTTVVTSVNQSPSHPATTAALIDNRPPPKKEKDPKSKSIGATLTRTVTKTFIRDSKESNKMPSSTSSTGTTPTTTPGKTTKEPKVKLSKQDKERIKQEKQAQKKKEKDEKKQQKKDKKPIGKSLSLTDVKKPSQPSSTTSNFADTKIFKVRLTQLVLANEGSLPAILTSTITVLSNSENVDVKQIFVGAENDSEVKSIRVRSDSGEKVDFSTITDTRTVAGLLELFFAELPQPLFNSKFYNDLIEIHDITNPQVKLNDLRNLISSLSQLRRSLLQILVTFFLSKYINNNPTMSRQEALQVMCSVFGPIFFRDIDPKTKHLHVAVREETLKLVIDNYVFLFEKTDQPDLKYESVDGKLLISEASVDKLIDKATDYYYPYNEKYFSLTFFISHIYFISASDLVDKLSTLFKDNHIDTKKKWKKQRRSKKANCISESVRLWVDYCYREMREDKKLSQKILKAFPHLEAHIGSRLTQSRGFGNILRVPKFHSRTRSASFSESFLSTTTGVVGKEQLSAIEIAEQCTLADYDLFTNVRLSDWVRLMHGSVDPSTAPSLSAALKKSTTWCQWAMGEILSAEDKAQRVAIIVLLVDIAIACRDLANFNTAISILNALNNHHIKRLTATWESVSKETVAKIQQLENSLQVWLKPDPNTAFTSICSSINSACVPHFSILRTVLSQIDNKIPTKTSDGNINVDKLRTVFGIVVELQRLQQQRNYTMKPTKLFIQLQDINTLSMDELADLSLKCEAPVSKAKKYNTPEQIVQQDWRDQIKKTFAKPLGQTSVGIDLPRLASSFTFRENVVDVSINNGNKIQDINKVLLSLASITNDTDLVDKINEQFNQYIPASTDPDSDFKRDLIRFLDEVCESDNSKLVNILKCCNQAIIAPVVIELTLNIAKAVPFMDAGGWRILISKTNPSTVISTNSLVEVGNNILTKNNSDNNLNENNNDENSTTTADNNNLNNNNNNNENSNIYVRHYKKQRSRSSQTKDYFEFEWFLQIELDQTCKNILSFDLKVSSLIFSTDTQASIRDPLLDSFKDYIVSQDCIQYINLNHNNNNNNNTTTTTDSKE